MEIENMRMRVLVCRLITSLLGVINFTIGQRSETRTIPCFMFERQNYKLTTNLNWK